MKVKSIRIEKKCVDFFIYECIEMFCGESFYELFLDMNEKLRFKSTMHADKFLSFALFSSYGIVVNFAFSMQLTH